MNRLLIIEDQDKTSSYLAQGFSEHNFIVDTAADGELAIHQIHNYHYKESLTLQHEIAIIRDYYQAAADDKDIALHINGEALLLANKIMIRRLLSNLLSNALQYTKDHGTIQFDLQEFDSSVRLTIRDNGIGIAENHLPRVFDRFYRVSINSSIHCGLGLSIVQSIVNLHHGKINITSELQKGTTITLDFPK